MAPEAGDGAHDRRGARGGPILRLHRLQEGARPISCHQLAPISQIPNNLANPVTEHATLTILPRSLHLRLPSTDLQPGSKGGHLRHDRPRRRRRERLGRGPEEARRRLKRDLLRSFENQRADRRHRVRRGRGRPGRRGRDVQRQLRRRLRPARRLLQHRRRRLHRLHLRHLPIRPILRSRLGRRRRRGGSGEVHHERVPARG